MYIQKFMIGSVTHLFCAEPQLFMCLPALVMT